MNVKCPNCDNPLDEKNLLKCPYCNIDIVQHTKSGLENLEKERNTISEKEEAIASRIDKRTWIRIRKRFLRYLLIFIAVLTGIFGISVWQIYERTVSLTSNEIKDIVTEKFAEPKVKETLTEVAQTQAKEIIENQIRPERNKITLEIDSFRSYLDTSESEFEEKYNIISNEVSFLKERNRLLKLGDKALVHGDRKAFDELNSLTEDLKKTELGATAVAEILRVKSLYLAGTRIKGISITYTGPDGIKKVDNEIPTGILIRDLKHHIDWRNRAKAGQLLRDRKEKMVPEALLYALREDQRLDVVKIALDSFESVTEFKATDVFDCEAAENWWQQNKDEVNKKLKDQESTHSDTD